MERIKVLPRKRIEVAAPPQQKLPKSAVYAAFGSLFLCFGDKLATTDG